MLYHSALYLQQTVNGLNLVHYVSFRVIAAMLTSLGLSLTFGPWFIEHSKRWFRAKSREYTPENHRAKDGMPTMGGLLMVGVVLITTVLWCNLTLAEVWLTMVCLVGFGAIGFWDDWSKIVYSKGIPEKYKFRAQVVMALLLIGAWYFWCQPSTVVCIPFFKSIAPQLGLLIIPWAMFIVIGTSNAVNLTDGLDGLAIGSLLSNFATFSVICYLAGHVAFAAYLGIPYAPTAEIAIIGAALVGASLGFLWFNAYPAQIFMGDVGSLALGATLAFMALLARQELLLALAGGLFVVETLSVMAQVFSFRHFGKRIFKMAPLHHHFELLGWPEAKITARFAIISLVLCLLALATLKIR